MVDILSFIIGQNMARFIIGLVIGLYLIKYCKYLKRRINVYIKLFIFFMVIFLFDMGLYNFDYIFRDRYELDTYKIVKGEIISRSVYYSSSSRHTYYDGKVRFYYNDIKYTAPKINLACNENVGDTIYIGVRKNKSGTGLKVIRPNLVLYGNEIYGCIFMIGYGVAGGIYLLEIYLKKGKSKELITEEYGDFNESCNGDKSVGGEEKNV